MTDEENTKVGIVCCMLFLVLIGAFLIYEDLTFKYDVYFDNGYENGFDIFIDGKNKGSVDPVSRVKISMSRGEHTIEIRKKNGEVFESNEVTLSEDKQYENCKYIYNIGRKYFYYVELCEYSTGGGTKRGGWDTEDIGSETFLRYYADFDLDEKCPKEITVRYGTSWTKSKLKRRINPTAVELEKEWYSGSGSGALDVGQTSTIKFNSLKVVDQAHIKAGCNDNEKMDGYIEYWNGQEWAHLASFSDVSCGDYVDFDPVTTDKLRLTMTGGGGDDAHISWHCCGSAGWKVHVAADGEKEEDSSPETQLDKSLVSYWNFDEDSGDIASDLSGNGNNGTIHGAKWVDGKYGTALSFDGVDDYVEVLTLEDPHTSDWTEEAWIKTTDLSAGAIMCKRHKESQESLTLHIGCWAGDNKKNNGLAYFSDDESNYEVGAVGTTNVANGKWHHLVGVRKGSNFYIYVDGNLESHNNINIGKFALNNIRSTNNWHIGHSGAWNVYFNGIIDEVRIYNYALTESEIKEVAQHHDTSSVTTKASYAQKIISSDIRGSENQYKELDAALGPPDAQSGYEGYVSLGGEGWIIVDMGKDIVDGTGYDLEIYELGSSYPDSNNEAYKIFASKYSDKDWIYMGRGLDISGFDLADAGVDSVRYVKIVDDTGTNLGESPGADIDAIAGFLH